MKKITCFICSLSSGGAENQIIKLSQQLTEHAYKVTLVTFSDLKDHYEIPAGINRVRIAEGRSKWEKLISIFWYFISVNADCVVSFGQRENTLCMLPLLFRKKVKIIAGERNFTLGRYSFLEKILMHFLYYFADYIVPNSYSQRNLILQQKPKWKNKVITITNYTDIKRYDVFAPPNNNILQIGIFARYTRQKNYLLFAKVVKQLKEMAEVSFNFDWYGNKTFKSGKSNKEYLHFAKLIDSYGIIDVIRLNDHVKDVANRMPEFDAICLPSLWEGFSNSISEAICCGKPMLVSNISDNGVMVKEGENGFLFNPESIDEICDAFLRFFKLSLEDRLEMGRNSRKIAESLFNNNEFVQSYINLIES